MGERRQKKGPGQGVGQGRGEGRWDALEGRRAAPRADQGLEAVEGAVHTRGGGCPWRLRLGSRGWEGQRGSKAWDVGEVFEGSGLWRVVVGGGPEKRRRLRT